MVTRWSEGDRHPPLADQFGKVEESFLAVA
jgi:hypothetical protein